MSRRCRVRLACRRRRCCAGSGRRWTRSHWARRRQTRLSGAVRGLSDPFQFSLVCSPAVIGPIGLSPGAPIAELFGSALLSAGVAQSAERLTRNEQVRGSIPLPGSERSEEQEGARPAAEGKRTTALLRFPSPAPSAARSRRGHARGRGETRSSSGKALHFFLPPRRLSASRLLRPAMRDAMGSCEVTPYSLGGFDGG